MYEQTNNRADLPIVVAVAILAGAWYVIARTLYLIKTLLPLWIRRISHDLDTARQIYAGRNIKVIIPDETPAAQVDRYHTRYEGTDRAANDDGEQ